MKTLAEGSTYLICAALAGIGLLGTKGAVCASVADLTLELSPHAPVLDMYEPLVLVYTLRNPTDVPLMTSVNLARPGGRLRISIREGDGPRVPYVPDKRVHARGVRNRISPGAAQTWDVEILQRGVGGPLVFPRPGQYVISATLDVREPRGRPTVVVSNDVSIDVRATSPALSRAISYLGSEEDFFQLLTAGPATYCLKKEIVNCYGELLLFLEQDATLPHAPAIGLRLVAALSRNKLESGRTGTLEEFTELFLERWPEHPAAARVVAVRIQHYLGQDSFAAARSEVDRFRILWPNRRHSLTYAMKHPGLRNH